MLVVISVLVGVGVLELVMWSMYDQPWYSKLTGEQADTSPDGYTRNNFGLRGPQIPPQRPDGEFRVLLLGDSFTFGLGERNDDNVFARIVERSLNSDYELPNGGSVRVLNGGIPGSLTDKWLKLWKRIGEEFDPDLVLLVFFLRDGTRTASIPEFFGVIEEEITRRNRDSLLYANSFIYRRIRDNLDRQDVGRRYTRRFQESYFGTEEQTEEWREAQRNLLEIRDLARASGAEVGFVVFPVLVELTEHYPFAKICELLEDFAVENDLPVKNLLPDYLGMDAPDLWVSTYDQHPNAAGHDVAAKSLTPFIADLLGARSLP
ncbi:SGNH/GDSL hydrolase family protein [Myxococcota bacterium]|nr:SGNH/GDSL hydrolase family protein [Myxococcota bacterium]